MTTLPNMGIVLPTRGPSGAGIWDDTQDENSERIDEHDHSAGKGVRVPSAGLNVNADLTFGDSFAPIDLHRVQFNPAAALVSNAQNFSLFTNVADNELYWRTNGGVNVKLTNGSALNVAAFAGGIGGDYTAVSAALNFDSAGNRYTLRDAGGAIWARMASGEVRIFETGTSENLFVGLAAPAALGSSYTITLPTAAPGTQQILQMTSAGVITPSNTVPQAVVMSSTLSVGGILTMVAEEKHPSRSMSIGGGAFYPGNNYATANINLNTSTGLWSMNVAPNDVLNANLPLRVGDRVTDLFWVYDKNTAAGAMTFRLVTRNVTTVTVRSTVTDSTAGGTLSIVNGINYTLVASDFIFLEVLSSNSLHRFAYVIVNWDRP